MKEGMTINFNAPIINNGGTINGNIYYPHGYEARWQQEAEERKEPLTVEVLKRKVDSIRSLITDGRLWFPVCKYMMWEGLCVDGDFTDAVEKLHSIYPDVKLNAKDLSSLNTDSLRKPLEQWDFKDSQFKIETTFNKYRNIAQALYGL